MKTISFLTIQHRAKELGFELVAALFNGRHVHDQIAALVGKDAAGNDTTVFRFKCSTSGEPNASEWTVAEPGGTIPRELILTVPPDHACKVNRYKWLCPQCGDVTNGDASHDSIFEIRHDARCVYCRVRAGEFRINGGKFERVKVTA